MESIMTAKRKYTDLNGLVLAGGDSSRMKTDKAMLLYHEKPQYLHLFDLLGQYCNQVFISCRKNRPYPLPCIFDQEQYEGPAAGLYSAFEAIPSAWLVVAVDYPFFTEKELAQLLDERAIHNHASVFYQPETTFFEPFLGIYEATFGNILKKEAQKENLSLQRMLKQYPVKKVIPENLQSLKSVDTYEEYLRII